MQKHCTTRAKHARRGFGLLNLGRNSSISVHQVYNFFDCPQVVCNSCFHCGSNAQGLVNPAEVVMHIVKRGPCLGLILDGAKSCPPKIRAAATKPTATSAGRSCSGRPYFGRAFSCSNRSFALGKVGTGEGVTQGYEQPSAQLRIS